jgi:hypothetical protein
VRRRAPAAIDAALADAATAMRATIRARGRTWRADLDALRHAVQTLASASKAAPIEEQKDAIGFTVDTDPDYFDEDSEHPEQGMTVDYEHETIAPTAVRSPSRG